MKNSILNTNFSDLKLLKKGKVRDVYELKDSFLMIATDRISAFDVVLPNPVPEKGRVLNQISLFWFNMMKDLVSNHVISGNAEDYPQECQKYADVLQGRSMLVKKVQPLAIECVVRGYISGSGWKDYQKTGKICGIDMPAGLKESDKLPEPVFTPSTKAEIGEHDINIDFETAKSIVGEELAYKARDLSLAIYKKGARFAETKGIIIADTKFEFGLLDNELILIDEVLTPDSSRFWHKDSYKPGSGQKSFDKQYVRDYLLSINWDKKPPAPNLPDEIIENTTQKYLEALKLIAGI